MIKTGPVGGWSGGGHQLHGGGVQQGNKTQINLVCLPGATVLMATQRAPLLLPEPIWQVELFRSLVAFFFFILFPHFKSISEEEKEAEISRRRTF